jgi:hypothetical protein
LLFVPFQYANAAHWIEVVRYEGAEGVFVSEPFTCNYSEWRIRYESHMAETRFPMIIPGVYLLNITTYPQGESTDYVDFISQNPTQGTYYWHLIHDRPGTFYMNVTAGYLDNYSIIVEQNTDSAYSTATPHVTASPTPTVANPAPSNISLEFIVTAVIAVFVTIAVAGLVLKRKKAPAKT